jgi:hypothetical protein
MPSSWWTYQLLTAHVRREAPAAGYRELSRLSRSKLHKVLVENLFRQMTPTMLREVRVATKQELIDRIHL